MTQPSTLGCSGRSSRFRVHLYLGLGFTDTTGALSRTQRSVFTARYLRLCRPVAITCLSAGTERSRRRVRSRDLRLCRSTVLASLCTGHCFAVLYRSLGLGEGIIVITDQLDVGRIATALSSLSNATLRYCAWILIYRRGTLTWTVSCLLTYSDSTSSHTSSLSNTGASHASLTRTSSSWIVLTCGLENRFSIGRT